MPYPSVSILIPTHNRCEILSQTLDSLGELRVPDGTEVELVVVANACTDDTERVVREVSAELPLPTKCVVEPKANLNVARNRAVESARGDVLVLLDDDVWVDPGWLEGLLDAYQNSSADIVGGKITLSWDMVARPDWMTDQATKLLTWKDHGDKPHERHSCYDAAGANFSFKRKVFETVGPFQEGLDRTGHLLLACGESEFIQRGLDAGFRLFYTPFAEVKHRVMPERVSLKYLAAVSYGNGISRVLIKPRFGFTQVLRAALGYTYLFLFHGVVAWGGKILGQEKKLVRHLLLRHVGAGGLVGVWRRVRGVDTPMRR